MCDECIEYWYHLHITLNPGRAWTWLLAAAPRSYMK